MPEPAQIVQQAVSPLRPLKKATSILQMPGTQSYSLLVHLPVPQYLLRLLFNLLSGCGGCRWVLIGIVKVRCRQFLALLSRAVFFMLRRVLLFSEFFGFFEVLRIIWVVLFQLDNSKRFMAITYLPKLGAISDGQINPGVFFGELYCFDISILALEEGI
jgi:hypothetical protein